MKTIFWKPALASLVALGLAVSCQKAGVEEEQVPSPGEEAVNMEDSPSIISGEMIVELSDELADSLSGLSAEEAGALLGVNTAERLYHEAGEFEARHRKAGLHRWYKLTYDVSESQTKASGSVLQIPGVISAEPVRRIKQQAIFNDPYLGQQWHYYNNGSLSSNHSSGCDINVMPVWESYTTGSSKVIVAVIDGGIDMSHEDLKPVTITGGASGSKNFVQGQEGYTITAHNHGTHVAGTIGAVNNNGLGGCGIAGGSNGKGGVKLLSCQVFANGSGGKDIGGDTYNAMVWAADHGAVICNNSWGYVYDTEEDAKSGSAGSQGAAIDYFIKYAGCDGDGNQKADSPMKGGVVFFSAGNEAWEAGWPAKDSRVIAVGSFGPDFTRAYYSNYGDWVDIAAPGGDQSYEKGGVLSSLTGKSSYGWYQGTSMACPHVTGVAALVISYFGGPGFTNEMLKERLLGGAKTGVLNKNAKIGPMIDAYGSMTYGGTVAPDPVSSYTAVAQSNNINFTWKVTKDSDNESGKKAYGYVLLASKTESALSSIDMKNIPSGVVSTIVEVGSLALNADISGSISGLGFETDYYVAIVGYDYWKNYSAVSAITAVKTGANNPPIVSTEYDGSFEVKSHKTLNVDYSIYDPDGHGIKVTFTPGSTAATNVDLGSGSYRLSIAGNKADPGRYTAKYTVKDTYGAETVYEITYDILENRAPEVVEQVESLYYELIGQKKAIKMSDYIVDPDEEDLTFTYVASPAGIVHLNNVSGTMNLTTLSYGLATVTVTGRDAKGLKASVSFQVRVREPSADPDVYPTQVSDYLYVSDGLRKEITVTITNSNGKELHKAAYTADVFNPAKIDLSSYAPGIYGVKTESDGKTSKKTIVKL